MCNIFSLAISNVNFCKSIYYAVVKITLTFIQILFIFFILYTIQMTKILFLKITKYKYKFNQILLFYCEYNSSEKYIGIKTVTFKILFHVVLK